MPVLTLDFGELGKKIKRIAKTPELARRAVEVTITEDAMRWIQWSIRGGDYGVGGASSATEVGVFSALLKSTYRQPFDTGDYKGSWRSRMTPDGGEVYSSANPPIKSGVIEEGRRAAWIPIEPLSQWVRRKFGEKDPVKARRIAFLISRKASRTRRPGLRVLARAKPKILRAFENNYRKELKKG